MGNVRVYVCVYICARVFTNPTTNLGKRERDVLFRGRSRVKFNKRKIQPGRRMHLGSFRLRRKYLRKILRFLSNSPAICFYFIYLRVGIYIRRDKIRCHNRIILTSAENKGRKRMSRNKSII